MHQELSKNYVENMRDLEHALDDPTLHKGAAVPIPVPPQPLNCPVGKTFPFLLPRPVVTDSIVLLGSRDAQPKDTGESITNYKEGLKLVLNELLAERLSCLAHCVLQFQRKDWVDFFYVPVSLVLEDKNGEPRSLVFIRAHAQASRRRQHQSVAQVLGIARERWPHLWAGLIHICEPEALMERHDSPVLKLDEITTQLKAPQPSGSLLRFFCDGSEVLEIAKKSNLLQADELNFGARLLEWQAARQREAEKQRLQRGKYSSALHGNRRG
jgi:hypothetical protein